MELAYVHTKRRADFGHHCEFQDVPARILEAIPSSYVPCFCPVSGDFLVWRQRAVPWRRCRCRRGAAARRSAVLPLCVSGDSAVFDRWSLHVWMKVKPLSTHCHSHLHCAVSGSAPRNVVRASFCWGFCWVFFLCIWCVCVILLSRALCCVAFPSLTRRSCPPCSPCQ